jgi:hypothetical protein
MARIEDSPLENSGWLHDLAKGELHPEADSIMNQAKAFDPRQLVEESTIEFLMELRECFHDFAQILNGYSEQGTRFAEVKIYSVAQTHADFMVFRNSMKLSVQNTAHGVIQLAFAQHARSTIAVNGQAIDAVAPHALAGQSSELIAEIGPFRDIWWTYQGQKVSASQVAKFYFSEFVRSTRDLRAAKTGNQELLQQIRSLLHERGIQL